MKPATWDSLESSKAESENSSGSVFILYCVREPFQLCDGRLRGIEASHTQSEFEDWR